MVYRIRFKRVAADDDNYKEVADFFATDGEIATAFLEAQEHSKYEEIGRIVKENDCIKVFVNEHNVYVFKQNVLQHLLANERTWGCVKKFALRSAQF